MTFRVSIPSPRYVVAAAGFWLERQISDEQKKRLWIRSKRRKQRLEKLANSRLGRAN